MAVKRVEAEPSTVVVELDHAALIIIDMQRDFLEPGGFGETLGNDVSLLKAAVPPLQTVLATARKSGMLVIHTREGHKPDLSDCPPNKLWRSKSIGAGMGAALRISDVCALRILASPARPPSTAR